jgi:hypothetical protein
MPHNRSISDQYQKFLVSSHFGTQDFLNFTEICLHISFIFPRPDPTSYQYGGILRSTIL